MTKEQWGFSLYLLGMVAFATFLASDGVRLTVALIVDLGKAFWGWWA